MTTAIIPVILLRKESTAVITLSEEHSVSEHTG